MPLRRLPLAAPALLLAVATLPAQAQQCSARLLVSGYFSNNVQVFDACSGAFLRTLDATRGVPGAQATRVGPDGLLYVIAENAGQVRRYRADTLDYVDTFIELGNGFGGTGLDFGPDGDIYVAGYNADTVRRFDKATGQSKGDLFTRNTALLNGPDNGMRFGPDGRLYIPGYDTHNVVAVGNSGLVQVLAPRTSGLLETRGLLFEPGGSHLLVTGERSGQVLRVALASGQVERVLVQGLVQPTGITYGPDGSLLVVDNQGVVKFDPATGARRDTLIQPGSNGLAGVTFLTVLPNPGAPEVVDATQVGSQYWVVGNAPLQGKVVDIPDMVSATGTVFGPDFDPADVVRKRWGSLRMEFTDCFRGRVSWNSTGANSAGFGSGGYEVFRLLHSKATDDCRATGFAQSTSTEWLLGAWYDPDHSGEGFLLDKGSDGEVFVAWFTHRPRQ